MRNAAKDAVRAALADPFDVCKRLGLLQRAKRTGGGVLICCPVHGDARPSCSVHVGRDRTIAVRCHACDWTGDVFSLIAAVEGMSLPRDFVQVLLRGAELGRVSLDDPPPRRDLPPLPARDPPPLEEVRRLLSGARDVRRDDLATSWLRSRGLEPAACAPLASALRACWPRWARYQGSTWLATGHRLLLPVYDALGALRSVRARAVNGESPKSLPPAGHGAAGLVLANRAAVRMLAAGPQAPGQRVVVTEGEPDFLTWASRLHGLAWAVIGLPGSGGWTQDIADRIPDASLVVARTDPDPAGDRYAAKIAASLRARCDVIVSDPVGRRARALGQGREGFDDNALLLRGDLPPHPTDNAGRLEAPDGMRSL